MTAVPSAAPRRRLPAAERRRAILVAAEEVFARSGYHRSSLEEIAAAAGVSKALIYEHFASKRELHASLLGAYVEEIFERFAASAATGKTGEARLRGGVDAFFGFVQERREAWRALFRDAGEPEVAEEVERLQRQAAGVIAALMAAEASGRPDAQAMEMHAQLLSGACQALANWWYDHQEVARADLVDRVVEFCWVGVERLSA